MNKENLSYWTELSKSLGCGGCSNITTVESPYTCKNCGRMLCGMCGEFCKDCDPKTVILLTAHNK